MTNRIWKLLGFLLIACLLLSGVSALAETGKVTVHLDILDEHLADKRFTDATGIEIEIFKVGEPVGGQLSSWGPTADFSAVSFDDYDTDEKGNKIYTDDQVKQIVADVEAVLEGNPSIPTAKPSLTTKAVNGDVTKVQVVFDELDPGIYYIRKAPSSRPRKMQSTGTLISIPSLGEKNDDVVVVDNQRNPYELNSHIKYTFDPIEQTKFTATKEWVDQDNFDGIQPKEIIVTLWRKLDSDEEPTKVETVTMERPADGGEWEYIWNPIDAEDENGDKYTFSVTEERVPGYDNPIIVDGHIINPHIPDYGCIEVTKKVTVGGNPTTTNLVDGVYAFTITGPTELAIEQRNDNNYFDAFRFDISIIGGEANSWSKTYVMPGTYVVEEIGMVENGKVVDLPTTVETDNAKIEIKVTDRVERDKDGKPVLTDPSDLHSKPKLLPGCDNGTITNNLNAGNLIIKKAVTLNGAPTNDPRLNAIYRFTVTSPDYPDYTDSFDITVMNGVCSPESVTLENLVPGQYIVTEDSSNLPVGVNIASGSGVAYTVNAGEDTSATVTNNLDIGSLKITKKVQVDGEDVVDSTAKEIKDALSDTYTFNVTGPTYPNGKEVSITVKDGVSSSVQLDDLLIGDYTVTEDTTGLSEGVAVTSGSDVAYTVEAAKTVEAEIVNNLITGKLQITKEVKIDGGDANGKTQADGTYTFTVSNDSGYTKTVNIEIKDGKSNTALVEDLVPGKYTVTEDTVALAKNYPKTVLVGENNKSVTVKTGETESDTAKFTNNYISDGGLTITKNITVDGKAPESAMIANINGTYTFDVTGPNGYSETAEITVKGAASSSATLTGLRPGEYTVKENTSNLPVSVSVVGKGSVTATVTSNGIATAAITNDITTGSIKITKHVTVNGKSTKETKADGTYTFTVKGPSYPKGHTVTIKITKGAANSVQLDDLLAGAYTVTEETSKLPSKMTLSSTNDLRLNVTGGTVTDASFTNDLGTPTPTPGNHVVVNPTPTPIPNTSINGQKVWNDEKNVHNTRPETITVQLLRDGVVIRETNVTGNSTDERWTYSFTGLPRMNAQGKDYEYTVREQPVTGYTTRIDGLTIFNDLIPQTPKEYTNFNGQKIWDDNDNADGARPNYIIVRLMRDGEEVDRRTVTGANSWQYTFQNMPLDDGYGHTYEYTIREDAVEGYVARIKDFDITNSRLPEVVNPLPDGLDNMVELYDYETPTWGRPLKTGDELPLYPIIFGGIGLTALVALVVLIVIGKKRENHAA